MRFPLSQTNNFLVGLIGTPPTALFGEKFLAGKAERFDLVGLLQGHFAPENRIQYPARMRLALTQTNDLLVGLIEEYGDSIAVTDNVG